MEQLSRLIIKFSFIPSVVVVIYVLIVLKDLPKELRTFSWFLYLSALTEIASRAFWLYKSNNMPLLHLYVAGGFFCLALFYEKVLEGFIDQKIIRGTLITFIIFTGTNSIFVQDIFTYNSYALTVESVLILILSLSTFMLMLEDIVKKKREGLARSLNWINSGLFIYYASSLIIFNFAKAFFSDLSFKVFSVEFNLQTWMLHAFFSFVMYSCFFVGLWLRPRNLTS